ncbi:hypothetical protein ACFL47_03695 [Candidatus Latescibacterota bacterium]
MATDDLVYDSRVSVDDPGDRFVPEGFYLDNDGIDRVPESHIAFTDE